MLFKVPRLYDSHTHFLSTGQLAKGLTLFSLQDPGDLAQVKLEPTYFRGEWLVGFGWDENKWASPKLPTRQMLDVLFPDFPVFLSRADGHSSWLNSRALKEIGWLNLSRAELPDPPGGLIHRDENGSPNGILSEAAHIQAFEKIPPYTAGQNREFLKAAIGVFNRAGFTHVRDMSCSLSLWQLLHEAQDRQELSLAYEGNFTAEGLSDVPRAIADCLTAKKTETSRLRALGVKVFFDGSLGSETALLSVPYPGKNGNRGIVCWDLEDIKEAMIRTWENNLEFSVHVIGDEAAHQIVKAAREVSAQGRVGRLNLEHVEILRPETIVMMKPLHLRCHMQPCHWLSDRRWLKAKLGELHKYAFPWESLRTAQIPLSFGSDSPIEVPSFQHNRQALAESGDEGIRGFRGQIEDFHSHPDKSFMDSLTSFDGDRVAEIQIEGRTLAL